MQRTEEDIQVSSFIAVYCIILRQDLLLNQRLADPASLAVQGTPGILLSLPWSLRHVLPCLTFYCRFGDLNSGCIWTSAFSFWDIFLVLNSGLSSKLLFQILLFLHMPPKRCHLAKIDRWTLIVYSNVLGRSAWQSECKCEILAVTHVCVYGWCWSCHGGVMIVSKFMDEFKFPSIFDTIPKFNSSASTLHLNI